MAQTRSPWGNTAPQAPRPGSGRAALARRATARGGRERRTAAAAARRARDRGSSGRRRSPRDGGAIGKPIRGAWNELVRHSRTVQQGFLATQRLRHVLLALAAVWVIWTFLLGEASLPRLLSVRHDNGKLAHEISELEGREATLKKEVKALETGSDPALVERLARKEHAMVREGEQLVRFVDEEGK
jgi:cell division protein FtsB